MVKCCVEGCIDTSTKGITYFNFPAGRELRRRWVSAVGPSAQPRGAVVCSKHFRPEDCESARGRTRLKAGAVPSVFEQIKSDEPDHSTKSDDTSTATENRLETSTPDGDDEEPTPSENHKEKSDVKDTNKEAKRTDLKVKEKVLKTNLKDKRKNLHEKLMNLRNRNKLLQNENGVLKSKIVDLENKNSDLGKGEGIKDGVLDKDESVDERVQNTNGEKEGTESVKSGDVKDSSSPTVEKSSIEKANSLLTIDKQPDIDKQPEDIEELLTNYHILQDRPLNIHSVTETAEEPQKPEIPEIPEMPEMPSPPGPVYIEISVDKAAQGAAETSDCLMLLESVQVELDPSELMLDHDLDLERERDAGAGGARDDPISLLTSSDEDDVIIEEPHIDTVEVSDETDEDDVPLQKLLKRRRAEKKKALAEADQETDFAKILWGMYEYYCVQCQYTTSSGTEYRRHTASHAKVLMMCQICGYMTASEYQFTKHEKQHGEKKYKCHLCSYKAKHNMSLLYHLKGHKAEDFLKSAEASKSKVTGKVFVCKKCVYTTKKRCDMKRHMTRKHKKGEDGADEDFVP